ncbi:hypothetical protein GE061_017772 [Apolygus lucorum]|uniref:Peptidoglycan binding-like domain-containing protein n=1 Tax=Apolygus lucorum TaxID=248454 RepID=A0A8S9XE22_APOLU|nr:hypothetical protein GE061_017772 [Apolygus lucorum]
MEREQGVFGKERRGTSCLFQQFQFPGDEGGGRDAIIMTTICVLNMRSPWTAISYLTQFGYLPEADRETGFLRSESQLRESIKNLQRFGNIPATGNLDDDTLELMSRPRCGIQDIPNFYKRRRRRFAVHGQKWHSTNLSWR